MGPVPAGALNGLRQPGACAGNRAGTRPGGWRGRAEPGCARRLPPPLPALAQTPESLARLAFRAGLQDVVIEEHEIDEQDPLKDSTLLSDGIDIWTSDNSDETQQYLMDILRRGQGVFAIAVGQVQRDLEGEILELFPTQAQPADVGTDAEATAT